MSLVTVLFRLSVQHEVVAEGRLGLHQLGARADLANRRTGNELIRLLPIETIPAANRPQSKIKHTLEKISSEAGPAFAGFWRASHKKDAYRFKPPEPARTRAPDFHYAE